MGDNTGIQWTDATWNPLAGCTPVSDGCRNCYAASMALRLEAMGQTKYAGTAKRTASDGRAVFTGRINLDEAALELPLRWKRPRRIFVNSMSDLFHEAVPDRFICDVFTIMQQASWHTFQVLTKRPERMAELLSKFHGARPFAERYPNVWCGTSVEDQQAADTRIPELLKVPAAVRFLSCEPLLGPVNLWPPIVRADGQGIIVRPPRGTPLIQWLICGGESGPNARPMHADWARGLRDQCQAAGVAFHFKQWGEYVPKSQAPEGCPEPPIGPRSRRAVEAFAAAFGTPNPDQVFWRAGTHASGRLLDGRMWDEFPKGV